MRESRKFAIVATFFLTSVVFALLLGEWISREYLPQLPPLKKDERNLLFSYDADLGWFPYPNRSSYFQADRRTRIKNNSLGFRDHEYGEKTKPRITFIGDSYTWGFDVEQNERFTEKLQEKIPSWEVMNLGVNGYGNDQEYLALKKHVDSLKPDIVFLLFCVWNDFDDNSASVRWGGYAKPYFVSENGKLVVKGKPVPKTPNYYFSKYPWLGKSDLLRRTAYFYFERVYDKIVPDPTAGILKQLKADLDARKIKFVVGVTGQQWSWNDFKTQVFDEKIESILDDLKIPWINLQTRLIYESHDHWTAEGNAWAAKKIFAYMKPWLERRDSVLTKQEPPHYRCAPLVNECRDHGYSFRGPKGKDIIDDCYLALITGEDANGAHAGPEQIKSCIGAPSAAPCEKIFKLCRAQGFTHATTKKNLLSQCFIPVMERQTVSGIQVTSDDIDKCRQVDDGIIHQLYQR